MPISVVNVVVPASGDGPIANIANLVGRKTVELSGRFVGRYILLGSHNGVKFAPVLIFDANGEESIKLTLNLALVAVRVRAAASSPSGVTMNVAGVLGVGSNYFATLGTLLPGTSGSQLPINLSVLFPPTGLEQDINFLCVGGFQGSIIIKGSMDGIHFNPLGSFHTDNNLPSLLGSTSALEFSPNATQDLIRFIQLDVTGVVTDTTTITIGGSQLPMSTGSSLDVGIVTVTDILYALQAKNKSVMPFTDSTGNTLSTLLPGPVPPDVTCIGQRNLMTYTGLPLVVIGSDNKTLLSDSVVIGQRLAVDCYGSEDVIIGQDITLTSPSVYGRSDIIAIGHDIHIGGDYSTVKNILIGRNLHLNHPPDASSYSYNNVVIGDSIHLGGNTYNNLIVGAQGNLTSYDLFSSGDNCAFGAATMGSNLNHCHLLGVYHQIESHNDHCTLVGDACTLKGFSSQVHMFGYGLYAGNALSSRTMLEILLAGTNLSCYSDDYPRPADQPRDITLVGHSSDVLGPNTDNTVVIGSNLHIKGMASSVVIGTGITFQSVGTLSCIVIGDNITFADGSFGLSVAIGGAIQIGAGGQGIAIGYYASIGPATYGIAIGPGATAASANVNNCCIAIGNKSSAVDSQCVIGNSDTANVPNPSIRHFVVRGVVGTIGGGAYAIDTISAISEPAADYTGLTITYNDGITTANKTIQVGLFGSLPPGAKALFIV
jgi:hypothetical protein